MWGALDPCLTLAAADTIAANFARAKFARVAAGHWLMIDSPEENATLLLDGV